MRAIKILRCSDSLLWYNDHIGVVVPFLAEFSTEYLSREPSRMTNIVKKIDSIIVDAELDEISFTRSVDRNKR